VYCVVRLFPVFKYNLIVFLFYSAKHNAVNLCSFVQHNIVSKNDNGYGLELGNN